MDLQGSIEQGIRNKGGVGSSAVKHTGRLRVEQLHVGSVAVSQAKQRLMYWLRLLALLLVHSSCWRATTVGLAYFHQWGLSGCACSKRYGGGH